MTGRHDHDPERILMTADTVGGVWTYALDLARGLAGHGVRVELATMGRPLSEAQWRMARATENLRIHESGYRLEWMDDPWEDVDRAGQWLLSLERDLSPDVVHVNGYAHAALPFAAPVVVAAHSCVLSWWRDVRGGEAPPRFDEYRRRVATGLARAKVVVAPSQAMAEAVETLYTPPAVCAVIPNGRRRDLFRPAPKEPFIFAAGRFWDAAKNLDGLAAVARDLPWPVRVAGEGAGRDAENLECLGVLSEAEMAALLSRAAIYALPARYEPFGLSVLEAALSGCALVLGDIPSLRENWEDAALFVPPDGSQALVETMDRLIGDSGLRQRQSRLALLRAARYSLEDAVREYLRLYRALLLDPTRVPESTA